MGLVVDEKPKRQKYKPKKTKGSKKKNKVKVASGIEIKLSKDKKNVPSGFTPIFNINPNKGGSGYGTPKGFKVIRKIGKKGGRAR